VTAATNGHTDSDPGRDVVSPTHDLDRLRDDYRAARLKRRTLEEQQAAARLGGVAPPGRRGRPLAESWGWDSGGGWAAGVMDILGRFDSGGLWPGIGSRSDKAYGGWWPLFRSEQDLNFLRQPSRILANTNAAGIRLLAGLTSYVIGGGFEYKFTARKGADGDDPLTKAVVAAAQQVGDDFLARNQWHGGEQPGLESELFHRAASEGEFFLCHYGPDGEGCTEVRTWEPEQVTMPPGEDWREWSFGIRAPPDDAQKVGGYYAIHDPLTNGGEFYEPDEVTHCRFNVPRSVKRGIPDFSFDVKDALHVSSRLRGNLGQSATIQAAIAYVMQHAVGTKEEVGDFAAGSRDYTRTNPFTGAPENVEMARPGRKEHIPEGMAYVEGPTAANAPNHIAILAECYYAGGARYCAPSWLTSGNSDAANFAMALVAESPFVKHVVARQKWLGEVFKLSPWRALANWCRRWGGLWVRLPGGAARLVPWHSVGRLVEVTVTAPSPAARNKLEEANRNKIEIESGYQSPQIAAEEAGRDYNRVKKDLAEIAKARAAQAPPPAPEGEPAPPSGQEGERQRTGDADRPEAAARPAVPAGLGEQVATLTEQVGRLTALLEEVRGGEFKKGGGREAGKGGSEPGAGEKPAAKGGPAGRPASKTGADSGIIKAPLKHPGRAFTGTVKDDAGASRYFDGGREVSKDVFVKARGLRPKKPPPEKAPSEKALRAKAAHVLVDKDIQRYAEEHNEPKFAAAVGGKSFPDGEPVDVAIRGPDGKPSHGIELKTQVVGSNRKITMKRSAMERKAAWESEHGVPVHTVIFDDTRVYNANGPGDHDESKRRILYKRGFGSFRTGNMHEVKDVAELKALMDAPEDQLPAAAKRPAGQSLGKLAGAE
jgi:hypothetical protein